MSKNFLQNELEQALRENNTQKVYELYKSGANLEEFTIIGISNIRGEWSDNVSRAVKYFMEQNPGVYYIPLNDISDVQDDNFIKHFSGLINPGAGDNFPKDRPFRLSDLDEDKMLDNEHMYQAIINQSNKFHIPYLGICSGSQHLVLNSGGYINREPGYLGGNHEAHFIYGTIPYFMMLEESEQKNALSECILPEVSFPIFTAHKYAAQKDNLGGVELGAVSELGAVEAHSIGGTKIGVQFHPENYYFEFTPSNKINRQKKFLDNFFELCINHHNLINLRRENNLSEQDLYNRMNMYDLSILSRLQECRNKGLSPLPFSHPYFDEYDVSSNAVTLPKESYNKIIEAKIDSYLNEINFSNPKMKYLAMQAIEDSKTLRHFLKLDQQPNGIQESFIKLEEALKDPNQDSSSIIQKFPTLFDKADDISKYAMIRIIKANHMEVAANIIAHDNSLASESFFKQMPKASILEISNVLAKKGLVDQAFDLVINNNIEANDIVKSNQDVVFEVVAQKYVSKRSLSALLQAAIDGNRSDLAIRVIPKITSQDILGRALVLSAKNNNEKIFYDLLPKVTDQIWLGKALEQSVEVENKAMFYDLLPEVTDQNGLGNLLKKSVINNDKTMFYDLLPKVTDQYFLHEALVKSVEVGNKAMFYDLLPEVTEQDLLGKALEEAIKNNNKKMFNALLPKVTDQEQLCLALEQAIKNNNKEMFDALLPKVTEQDLLGKALEEAIKNNNKEMFDALLHKVTDDYYLVIPLLKSVELENKAMFDALLPKVIDQEQLGLALEQAIQNNNKAMFYDLLPKVTYQRWLGESLEQAIQKNNKEMFDALLHKVIDRYCLATVLVFSARYNNKEMSDALELALKEDINTRQEKMLKYLLTINISPEDFSNHLKALAGEDYTSVIKNSLSEINDVNFLKEVAEKSEDNIKNIVNERLTNLLEFDRASGVANYILEKTMDMFGGLPVAAARNIPIDNSKSVSSQLMVDNNLIPSGLYNPSKTSEVVPAVNTALPDFTQQIQFGAVLAQLVNNSYKAIQNHFNQSPHKIHLNRELQKTNDNLHRRLVNLSNASGLSQELEGKANSMSEERKDIAKKFIVEYKEISDQTKPLAENYYNMKNPTKEELKNLSEKVKTLNGEFKKLILETVKLFPEVAPNKQERINKSSANVENIKSSHEKASGADVLWVDQIEFRELEERTDPEAKIDEVIEVWSNLKNSKPQR